MHITRLSLESPVCVPFAWEEKPGVPKALQQNVNGGPPAAAAAAPSRPAPAIVSFPLCKPPCLQVYDIQGPLAKTPSFNSIFAASRHGSKRRVRRPSFDNIIFSSSSNSGPDESFYSHMLIDADCSSPAQGALARMEDDPFVMALQACRKESFRVSHHRDTRRTRVCEEVKAHQRNGSGSQNRFSHHQGPGRIRVVDEEEKNNQRSGSAAWNWFAHHQDSRRIRVCEEEEANGGAGSRTHQDIEEGFLKQPPPTIGPPLFAQHLHQDNHMQTLIGEKKHANGFFAFLASCFGCHYLTSH